MSSVGSRIVLVSFICFFRCLILVFSWNCN